MILQSRIRRDPQCWYWCGDGVTFIANIEDENGNFNELLRLHIPNDETVLGWHDISVPLADYAGQHITLVLQTDVGLVGDPTGDQAGWDSPQLMWKRTDS